LEALVLVGVEAMPAVMVDKPWEGNIYYNIYIYMGSHSKILFHHDLLKFKR
jgi:hypothetical protein